MVYAAIDIHKHVFHAAALDVESGEMHEQRFAASREALRRWASDVNPVVVAIEATCGWRWVVRELQAAGLEVQLADPGQAVALKGKRRRAKTDRLDARVGSCTCSPGKCCLGRGCRRRRSSGSAI